MPAEGTWDLSISTPIGKTKAVVDLRRDHGVLTGTAYGTGEEVPLTGLALHGDQLTWKQAATKPMRLNLAFTVTLADDTLTGTSKAERLTACKVTGQRRTILAATEHRP